MAMSIFKHQLVDLMNSSLFFYIIIQTYPNLKELFFIRSVFGKYK
jgi:hypothetical protein